MIETYDVLIVGGGPAGLSAALLLGRCRRRVVICDGGRPRNLASPCVRGLLGHEGLAPNELLARGRQQLEAYKTVFSRSAEVTSIWPADTLVESPPREPTGSRWAVPCVRRPLALLRTWSARSKR